MGMRFVEWHPLAGLYGLKLQAGTPPFSEERPLKAVDGFQSHLQVDPPKKKL